MINYGRNETVFRMNTSLAQIMQKVSASRLGYIICQPKTARSKKSVNFNREAYRILSYHFSSRERDIPAKLASLCAKWKRTFNEREKRAEKKGKTESLTGSFIELFKSGKRTYVVRAVVLYEDGGSSLRNSQYMFILERVRSDLLNIPQVARERGLTQREQELIELVFSDMSNKEISQELGLSLNTVKTYLKNLMRKVGVNSRAGLISSVLIDKNPD